jgi:hypothetical protein
MMKKLFFLSLLALADDPLEPAREAFVKGEYEQAIRLAKSHANANPRMAWRVIGASHCFLKDQEAARSDYEKLDPAGQAFLKYVCSRNSVKLP